MFWLAFIPGFLLGVCVVLLFVLYMIRGME